MSDPLHPSATVLIKLGSALVHAEEALFEVRRGGIAAAALYDIPSFDSMANDPEIKAWREEMDAMALLPVKR